MIDFQMWLLRLLSQRNPVSQFMQTTWAWPTVESLHFIGLSMLVGAVSLFDMRLLGVGRRIPIAAAHRLIPWGLAGFALSIVTGTMFLMTDPDQYIFNSSFHFKMLFLAIAGLNAGTFYVTSYGRILREGLSDAPRSAKVIAAVSLCLWVSIIACGRLITFYRPGSCGEAGPGLIADCLP